MGPSAVSLLAAALVASALDVSAPLAAPVAQTAPAAGVCEAKPKPAKLNFRLKGIDGKSLSLEAFKGKVILLDFWATWCVPCKAEIPRFIELQERYRDAGLQVIGVSVDDPPEKLRSAVSAFGFNYPALQGRNRGDLLDAYGVIGIPVTVVIGRDATICQKYAGSIPHDRLQEQIERLLQSPTS